MTSEQIQKKLADRKLLLLLDGLNEVTDSNVLADLKNNFSKAPMLVSTRETGTDLGIDAQLVIQPLKSLDIEEFFRQKLDRKMPEQIQKLCAQAQEFGTPLMAWMLYCIFQMMEEKVPTTRGEAYQLFTSIYEKKAKQEFNLEDLRREMSKLAVEMMAHENSLFESEAQNLLTIPIFKRLQASHLLQYKSYGRARKLEFCHPTIQEYYAAEYLIGDRQQFESSLVIEIGQQYSIFQQDYLNNTQWKAPISLMLGFPEVDQLALEIVEQALDVDLMLGARLAGEVRSELDETAIKSLSENLSEYEIVV